MEEYILDSLNQKSSTQIRLHWLPEEDILIAANV
jgi:hypothetical protein